MSFYKRGTLGKVHENFFMESALGNVTGYTVGNKFGRNPSVSTSEEIINDLSTTSYTYTTAATTYYISSSNNSDTDQTVTVVGIDENWDEQTVTVSLAGQTKTALSGSWLRVYRAYLSAGSNLAGDMYIYENDTVTSGVPQTASKIRAKVLSNNGQTQMAQLTVPRGLKMLVTDFLMSSGKDNDMEFKARIRNAETPGPWRVIFDHDVYRTTLALSPEVPYVINEKTDIEVTAKGGTGTSEAAVSWSYLLTQDY